MEQPKPQKIGKKMRAVRDTVIRNRVVPPSVLHRLHFEGSTQNAVAQCVRSLREQGWIQTIQIVGHFRAYSPARRAVRAAGLPVSWADNPLSRQPLEQNLGATLFCALDRPRKRLLPRELLAEYPWFPKPLVNGWPFYFDHDDGMRRLAMIRVELSASPYRIVKKHQEQMYRWCEKFPPLRKLLDRDQFMIVSIVDTPEAVAKLAEQINKTHAYPRARLRAWPTDYFDLIISR